MAKPKPLTLTSCADARAHLVKALHADFIGPFSGDEAEILPLPPSRWYMAGFLAPQDAREPEDPTDDDEMASGNDEDDGELPPADPEPKRKNLLPSSIGLSVLVPPGQATDVVTATIRWAEYTALEPEDPTAEDAQQIPARRLNWQRVPRTPVTVTLALDAKELVAGREVHEGIFLVGHLGVAKAPGIPKGTRALSLFVVNRKEPGKKGRYDEEYLFQISLEVAFAAGLVERPNRRDEGSDDWDDQVNDLQYRGRMEYAVGHGVSVEVLTTDGRVTGARTAWIPTAVVKRVDTGEVKGVVTSMDALAVLENGAQVRAALAPLLNDYATWISGQRATALDTDERRATRDALMNNADRARARIAEGMELLATSPDALTAFRIANQAMATAARRRSPERYTPDKSPPSWRLFQLAFVVMNLPSIIDDGHKDREAVELIYFPTGGGKTEAYLGVIAFTLVLRRLRGQATADKGLGVAVMLRYTLRLLTLDQLSRAATLICALEMIRRDDQKRLGDVRFAIGLWVGRTATANTLAEVSQRVVQFRNGLGGSPFPLTECPWCKKPIEKDNFDLRPNQTTPTEVIVRCGDFKCAFAQVHAPKGIPVLFVDEQLYQELPCFLVATVDKFALLPWRAEAGMLFGRVRAHEGLRFYGPVDAPPKTATLLPKGLLPPELVVQDELHLISGPLGSMVGLYETAIEALCTRTAADGTKRAPRIVASTATVRRARQQVRALFGRRDMAVFPPPGVDANESFFAVVDHKSEGRLYVGIASPGRAMKAILLRSYTALLGAAQRVFDPKNGFADPYMTLAGYFNALRELGGMRRLVEDEVADRLTRGDRRPVGFNGESPWFASRDIKEPVELTSRERTTAIAKAKARLAASATDADAVDVLLASNMISVGVDIERLGLMVVAGQPKSVNEYIQASSRVGRDAKRPGLVVTVFNTHKPRDRSYYERFAAFHDCFYRFVEATSVTPFSGPALERGLAGVLVGLVRHTDATLTPPNAVMALHQNRKLAERATDVIAARARRQPRVRTAEEEAVAGAVKKRGINLLDAWESIVDRTTKEAGADMRYSPWDKGKKEKALLFQKLDAAPTVARDDAEEKFSAPSSMRDVEDSVPLWISRKPLGGR